jgi:hypothetical protein
MISSKEAFAGLYGALRLARLDPGGMAFFDKSLVGFWRSFFAAVLVAPLFIILLAVRHATGDLPVAPLRFLIIESTAYLIGWTIFPLIMISVADSLDRTERYLGFIVAYNWASVWQNLVYLPFLTLTALGVVPRSAATIVNELILLVVLGYIWFIAKSALQIGTWMAVLIVVMDFSLAIFIGWAVQLLMLAP